MKTTKIERMARLLNSLSSLGFNYSEAQSLRRIEMTLQRWGEAECGDSNEYCSTSIERDETTGKPYRCVYPNNGPMRRYPVADRESGALKRLSRIMAAHPGLWFYHQTDCRGCMLYVGRKSDLQGNRIVEEAQRHGFKFELFRRSEPGDNPKPAIYRCKDLPGRDFTFPEQAAVPFLKKLGKPVPESRNLPVDQYYTRGVAVCI